VEAAEALVLLYERAQDVAAGGSGSVAVWPKWFKWLKWR